MHTLCKLNSILTKKIDKKYIGKYNFELWQGEKLENSLYPAKV